MFDKLAQEIKEARENLQFTHESIASRIKIDKKFLENFEKGNFTFLPDLYIKAYLKEIACVLELDEKTILKKYEAAKHGKTFEDESKAPQVIKETLPQSPVINHETVREEYSPIDDKPTSEKINKNKILYFSIGGSILFLLVIYLIFFKGSSDQIITERPFEEVIQETKERFVEQASTTDSLMLNIKTRDSSWISVKFDDALIKEYYLRFNQSLDLKAKTNFTLTIGKAASVEITLNGTTIDFDRGRGGRVLLFVDSSGVKNITPQRVAIDTNRIR